MKKSFLFFAFITLCFGTARSQVTVFSESFDGASVSMVSTGTPGFVTTTSYFNSSAKSMQGNFSSGSEVTLTSPSFATTGNNFVSLSFKHICKVSFFDSCLVEYSIDNGSTWDVINPFNSVYSGMSSVYAALGNFNAGAYSTWDFTNATTMSNNWWQTETFEVSALIGNAANVKIRFRSKDDASANGMQSYVGWFIDDVEVIMSPCELVLPVVQLTGNYPNGITFGTGPFTIHASVTDINSGVDSTNTYLHYTVSSGGVLTTDSALMSVVVVDGDTIDFTAQIPGLNDGDTVCYAISASDLCGNTSTSNTICAYISTGISIPFADNFDSGNAGWSSVSANGSAWELGTPAYGLTTGSYSNPNSWDVALTSQYLSATNCYLESPVFDFSTVPNSALEFYHNFNSESGWDGMHIEYSTDAGNSWSVLGLVNDPNATNWYNDAQLNSSSTPAWTGNSQGWKRSTYQLSSFSGFSDIRFRFVFTSDFTQQTDGYSIDNFSILLPNDNDLEIGNMTGGGTSQSGANVSGSVTVNNNGGLAANSFGIQILINGSIIDTIQVNTPLLPGDSAVYPFTYFAPDGDYTICSEIIYSPDTILLNNNYCLTGHGVVVETVPYFNDFENTSGYIWQTDLNTGSQWELGMPAYGATTGTYSGLNCWDVNLNSTYTDSDISYLYTPYFSVTPGVKLRLQFYANYNVTKNLDGVYLEYENGQSGVWTKLGTYDDNFGLNWYNDSVVTFPVQYQFGGNSGGWEKSFYNIHTVTNSTMRFRFVFLSSAGGVQADGFSVDDFSLTVAPADDIGVTHLTGIIGQAGQSLSPQATIKNYGTAMQLNYSANYKINGVLQTPSIFNGPMIVPGQSVTVSLNSFTVPNGSFDICGFTSLATDGDHSNDTTCVSAFSVNVFNLPYSDDFEGTQEWSVVTTGDPNTNWELGMPAFGATTGTHSGNNCWDVNLVSAYTDNSSTMLLSPFFNFSSAAMDTLSFWHNFNNEQGWDGVRLEYDINNADNWQVLGTVNDPLATNWYNDIQLNSSLLPGWTSVSGGWVQSKYDLSPIGTPSLVRFRFVFTSDAAVTRDGHSIDDFSISNALANDIAVSSVTSPGATSTSGIPVALNVNILNSGLNPSGNFNVYYSLNNGAGGSGSVSNTTAINSFSNLNILLGSITPSAGSNTLKIYTDMASDMNRNNDTLYYTFNAVTSFQLPYSTDFETSNNDWTSVPASIGSTEWEWGMPAFGTTSSTHSGNSCWDVNLTAPYGNVAFAYLLSPYFNYVNTTQSQLSFYTNYSVEYSADGFVVQYSTDDINWTTLGTFNDPLATNWYNLASVTAFGGPAWTGSSQGWQQVTYNTSALEGYPLVRYRFLFRSDVNLSGDGVSIDDISISGVVGINNNESTATVTIHPNPTNGIIYINASTPLDRVQVLNTEGRLVQDFTSNKNASFSVDVTELPAGVYLLRLMDKEKSTYKKFVKQ